MASNEHLTPALNSYLEKTSSRDVKEEDRLNSQHSRGKLGARERISLLLDPGSFQELDRFVIDRGSLASTREILGDAVITGHGTIDNRLVFVYSQDFTAFGGTLGEAHGKKICKVMDLALANGAPLIGMNDGGGARIQEGVVGLSGYGEIFYRNVRASGVIPQISCIVGPSAGGASYSPAITDFILMVEGMGQMFVTGPNVIREVTGEEVTIEELGGATVHTTVSGVAQLSYESEEECYQGVRDLLSYLPQNNKEDPPFIEPTDDPDRMDEALDTIIPEDSAKAYDMYQVLGKILDNGTLFEIQANYAQNLIIGMARMGGYVIGIVAQQPMHMAGALDINASIKAARFIRFCDAFNIPIVMFTDVPGYMPGKDQEYGGIIKHGAKLLYAYAEATVPKITVLTRKAYGGAYIVMGSRPLGADAYYAWPTGEIAVMGPEGAVEIISRRDLDQATDRSSERARLAQEFRTKFSHPYIAAGRGDVDDIIEPKSTRPRIIKALEMLANKRDTLPPKKHGNIPL
jgi:propionyl-CoA carboxylase beta chain